MQDSEFILDKIQVLSVNLDSGEKNVAIIFLYIPPKIKRETVKKCVCNILHNYLCKKQPVVFAGDFNFDNLAGDNFVNFMLNEFNLRYLVTGSTTEYKSALDHIYTNLPNDKVYDWGTLESYYSDNKPIYICV